MASFEFMLWGMGITWMSVITILTMLFLWKDYEPRG